MSLGAAINPSAVKQLYTMPAASSHCRQQPLTLCRCVVVHQAARSARGWTFLLAAVLPACHLDSATCDNGPGGGGNGEKKEQEEQQEQEEQEEQETDAEQQQQESMAPAQAGVDVAGCVGTLVRLFALDMLHSATADPLALTLRETSPHISQLPQSGFITRLRSGSFPPPPVLLETPAFAACSPCIHTTRIPTCASRAPVPIPLLSLRASTPQFSSPCSPFPLPPGRNSDPLRWHRQRCCSAVWPACRRAGGGSTNPASSTSSLISRPVRRAHAPARHKPRLHAHAASTARMPGYTGTCACLRKRGMNARTQHSRRARPLVHGITHTRAAPCRLHRRAAGAGAAPGLRRGRGRAG